MASNPICGREAFTAGSLLPTFLLNPFTLVLGFNLLILEGISLLFHTIMMYFLQFLKISFVRFPLILVFEPQMAMIYLNNKS